MQQRMLPWHTELNEDFTVGIDPGRIQLWRHKKQAEEWELIQTKRSPTTQELNAEVCAVPVTVSQGWKEIRFSIARLFGRKETSTMTETVPQAERDIRVERHAKPGIPALLLWAKEAGVILDENVVRDIIGEYSHYETIGPRNNICLIYEPRFEAKKSDPIEGVQPRLCKCSRHD